MAALASLTAYGKKFTFRVNPYDVSWGYNMRTHIEDTYGGKVVQILGVNLTDLKVQVVAGNGGLTYANKLFTFFRDMCLWQQNEEKPAIFSFPSKNYRLQVWGQQITIPDSINNVHFPIDMSFQIESDLGGNLKKSAMRAELQKLAKGVGYTENQYNMPGEAEKTAFQDVLNLANSALGIIENTVGAITNAVLGTDSSLSAEQQTIAQAVIGEAIRRNLGTQGAIIGLMTAMTESTLTNVQHGDSLGPSSRGVFQQMGSWGSEADRMDPAKAAGFFYEVMVQQSGWETSNTPWTIAQDVQRSEFTGDPSTWQGAGIGQPKGENYHKNYDWAVRVVKNILGGTTTLDGNTKGEKVVNAAKKWLGTTYAWGGGDANGPTQGIRDGNGGDTQGDYNKIGFDCSGLALYAWSQVGVSLSHSSGAQYGEGSVHPSVSDLKPGDLVFYSNNGSQSGIHHVAIVAGNNQMIEAPQSGDVVRISTLRTTGEYFGATRFG